MKDFTTLLLIFLAIFLIVANIGVFVLGVYWLIVGIQNAVVWQYVIGGIIVLASIFGASNRAAS